MNKSDIADKEDIDRLLSRFYDKVRVDEMLSPLFSHVDWEHHLPVIADFWAMVLLGDPAYKGNPFHKHQPLGLQTEHFERWLKLFLEAADENFSGQKERPRLKYCPYLSA